MIDPLTLAAANAAGPVEPGHEAEWRKRVTALALDLLVLDSEIRAKADLVHKIQSGQVPRWAVIRQATLTKVELNQAGRGVIHFQTYSANEGENVDEYVYTEFQSTTEGERLISLARSLIGHVVDVYKYQEDMAGQKGKTVRMCAHLVDRGLPTPATPSPAPAAAPEPSPAPAADNRPVNENDAKEKVLEAAGGDKEVARAAWSHIGAPSGQVASALVERAIVFAAKNVKES